MELNRAFVERLEYRFQTEPTFQAVADRARVLHCPVEDLPSGQDYHVIVSGLPLNNFAVADVQRILSALMGLLRPAARSPFSSTSRCGPCGRSSVGQQNGAAPRHRPGNAHGPQWPRNPPRRRLAQRPARLGPPLATPHRISNVRFTETSITISVQ